MLIGNMPEESNYPESSCIVDMFTLINGIPQRVIASSERVVYKFRSDNMIYLRGSSGAGYSSYDIYRFNGTNLERMTCIEMADRNFYLDEAPISEELFWQKVSEFENPIVDYSRIAFS